jgi:hypothetical protein
MFSISVFHRRAQAQPLCEHLSRLLIAVLASFLAACASQPGLVEGSGAPGSVTNAVRESERMSPRLRRESIARSAIVNSFGNVAIESAIDAPCGFRDASTAVICLNVAGEFNAPDLELVRARLADGAVASVRSEAARSALMHALGTSNTEQATTSTVANARGECDGACSDRIELVRPR